MSTSGSDKILWNGKKYRIDWRFDDQTLEVATTPNNADLKKEAEQNIREFGKLKLVFDQETALERERRDKDLPPFIF